MQGLQDLRVNIYYSAITISPMIEARILEPLRAVHGPDTFEVKLPWKGEYEFDAPFKIIRPEIG